MSCRRPCCNGLYYPILEYRSHRSGEILRSREPIDESDLFEAESGLYIPEGEDVAVVVARCPDCNPELQPKEEEAKQERRIEEQVPARPWWAEQ
jgi:hypothetical protein